MRVVVAVSAELMLDQLLFASGRLTSAGHLDCDSRRLINLLERDDQFGYAEHCSRFEKMQHCNCCNHKRQPQRQLLRMNCIANQPHKMSPADQFRWVD